MISSNVRNDLFRSLEPTGPKAHSMVSFAGRTPPSCWAAVSAIYLHLADSCGTCACISWTQRYAQLLGYTCCYSWHRRDKHVTKKKKKKRCDHELQQNQAWKANSRLPFLLPDDLEKSGKGRVLKCSSAGSAKIFIQTTYVLVQTP